MGSPPGISRVKRFVQRVRAGSFAAGAGDEEQELVAIGGEIILMIDDDVAIDVHHARGIEGLDLGIGEGGFDGAGGDSRGQASGN